jgi:hypothetical protein
MNVWFPGESAEYKAALDRLLEEELELRHAMEAVAAASVSGVRAPRYGRTTSSRARRATVPGGRSASERFAYPCTGAAAGGSAES